MTDQITVGRVDCTGEKHTFPTTTEAETFMATVLTDRDPNGVKRGDYYIDTPELETWIEPEERCYPSGGFHRKARVRICPNKFNADIVLPYGKLRMVRASIPDTFFSIPAKLRLKGSTVRGFITQDSDTDELQFFPEAK